MANAELTMMVILGTLAMLLGPQVQEGVLMRGYTISPFSVAIPNLVCGTLSSKHPAIRSFTSVGGL